MGSVKKVEVTREVVNAEDFQKLVLLHEDDGRVRVLWLELAMVLIERQVID